MAADRGAASEAMSIFVLLNSSMVFSNRHDVEITQPRNPLDPMDGMTPEERWKSIDAIVAALPDVE